MAKNTTTVTIDEDLLKQARHLNINISSAAERGVMAEVRSLEQERVKKLYREAGVEIERRIEEVGLFSDGMRTF